MKITIKQCIRSLFFLGLLLSLSAHSTTQTTASNTATMCVFDLMGRNGPLSQSFQEIKVQALSWGINLELKHYLDERIAAEDFKAGICDIVNVTGFRARAFNQFTGTIDSIGALPTYEHLKLVIQALSSKKAAALMKSGDYEVLAIIPAGAIYMFVNDNQINSPKAMVGKSFGVLDSAPELPKLATLAGMTPVASSISNVYGKFNNRSIDIAAGPAVIYGPMEIQKGLEPNGGVLDYPFMQSTMQVLARHKKLPVGLGEKIRELSNSMYTEAIKFVKKSEDQIPDKYWVHIPESESVAWSEMFRQNRIALRDENIYNGKALRLFRKIRCKLQATLPECSAQNKE